MIAFWIVAAIMVAVALSFLAPRLIRGPRQGRRQFGEMAIRAREQLKSLEQAYRDGHLKKDDYQQRRDELSQQLMAEIGDDPEPDEAMRSTATAVILVLVAPVFTLLIYRAIGDPIAIRAAEEGWISMNGKASQNAESTPTGGEDAQAPDLSQAIAGLEARLEANPEDLDGWFLLGRSYMSIQSFDKAREAYGKALALGPNEAVIMVEYAEALAFANGQADLPQEAEELLRKALALEPNSQKGLWMMGLSEIQKGNTQSALDHWQRLLDQLEPGSEVAGSLIEQINLARAEIGQAPIAGGAAVATRTPEPPPVATAAPSPGPSSNLDAADMVALTVEVSLSTELSSRVQPSDTVFVFARAVNGPPMPLAIQRLAAGQLPITVRLDESMAMMPAMSLANFPQVVIGARISRSGNASPQPGDLQAMSDPVATSSNDPVRLNIDTVL